MAHGAKNVDGGLRECVWGGGGLKVFWKKRIKKRVFGKKRNLKYKMGGGG